MVVDEDEGEDEMQIDDLELLPEAEAEDDYIMSCPDLENDQDDEA
jgi:hypothetical protein